MKNSWGTLTAAALTAVVALTAFSVDAQVPRRPESGPQPSPAPEAHHHAEPEMSPEARRVPFDRSKFGDDPRYEERAYDPAAQFQIYGGKKRVEKVRPLIELFQPLYSEGPLGPTYTFLGTKNPVTPQFYVYGDLRTVAAFNDNGAKEVGQVATRLNLDVDLKITSTERIHALFRPLDRAGKFTRYEFFGNDFDRANRANLQFDMNPDTLFFEGDLGPIWSGISDEYVKWDIPITFGLIPLVFQNGTWVDDAFVGGAFTIPALNSPVLDITNMDFTFFAGTEKVSTPALKNGNVLDDNGSRVFGAATFVETLEGYFEGGVGRVDDLRPNSNFSYNSVTAAWSKRYYYLLSNSMRVIHTFGQDPAGGARQTADGTVLLLENSLITSLPSTLVPYANFFVGLDRPQSLARDNGGVLKNVGINFETDAITAFPKLDDNANDTYGGAVGLQYLFSLNRQIVVEAATVQVRGGDNKPGRTAKGDQYALGFRYQYNLSPAWIFRTDGIYGWLDEAEDIAGIRVEFRRKW
jgi:hypothetical protein